MRTNPLFRIGGSCDWCAQKLSLYIREIRAKAQVTFNLENVRALFLYIFYFLRNKNWCNRAARVMLYTPSKLPLLKVYQPVIYICGTKWHSSCRAAGASDVCSIYAVAKFCERQMQSPARAIRPDNHRERVSARNWQISFCLDDNIFAKCGGSAIIYKLNCHVWCAALARRRRALDVRVVVARCGTTAFQFFLCRICLGPHSRWIYSTTTSLSSAIRYSPERWNIDVLIYVYTHTHTPRSSLDVQTQCLLPISYILYVSAVYFKSIL